MCFEGNPDADKSDVTAHGPGTGVTLIPSTWALSTTRAAGSDMAGVPASDAIATRSPFFASFINSGARCDSLWAWRDRRRGNFDALGAIDRNRRDVTRVS